MKTPSIVAIDPGGTTGIFYMGPDKQPRRLAMTGKHHHLAFYQFLLQCMVETIKYDPEAKLVVICEDFTFRKDDSKRRDKIDYTPKEYVGVARLFAFTYTQSVLFRYPQAAQGKGFWDDDKLRRVGMWNSSKHIRDATRHYLNYVSFELQDHRYLLMLKDTAPKA